MEVINNIRKRIFEVIEPSADTDKLGSIYDRLMMVAIFASLVPLTFKEDLLVFQVLDKVTVSIFIVDYILRMTTADFKFGRKSISSFLKYPFTFLAVIDLISILPSIMAVNSGLKMLRIFRMIRVLRVFKTLKYSKSVKILVAVFRKSREALVAVGTLAVAYILISALVIFNIEPDSFNTFFDAVYWATISLTTVGYGDIYPVTTFGRVVTMLSSLFGVAIIALPAGVIAAGYISEVQNNTKE